MSKLTIIDDAGNAQDIALPPTISLVITPIVVAPPSPTPVPAVPPPLTAGFSFVVTGASVAFRDESTGAVRMQWVWGNGGDSKTMGDQVCTFRTAETYTVKQIVWDAADKSVSVSHDVTTTVGSTPAPPAGSPALPASPNPPVIPPPKPTATGAHTVEVLVTEGGKDWSVQAHVDEDWTVDGQYTAVYADDTAHVGIRARIYSDGVDVGACSGSNGTSYVGTLTVKYDGAVVFGPEDVQFLCGRMNKTVRYGPQAPWHPVDMSLFPNWAKPAAPLPLYDLTKFKFGFNDMGVSPSTKMGDGGAHGNIAYVPQWGMPFIMLANDPDADPAAVAAAFAVVRAAADNSGIWGIYRINDATGLPYDITQYPDASLSYAKASNPIAMRVPGITPAIDTVWDQAHQTGYNFVAAAATGTARDKWHAAVHANAVLTAFNPEYRRATGVFKHYQTRGSAWALRSLFLASYVSCMPEYFAAQLEVQRKLAPRDDPNGMSCGYFLGSRPVAMNSSWMLDYLRIVVNAMVPKLPAWADYRDYLARGTIASMNGPQYQATTTYRTVLKDTSGNWLPNFPAVLEASWQCAENGSWPLADTQALTAATSVDEVHAILVAHNAGAGQPGDFRQYQTAPDAYPALRRAVCAMAADSGLPGGAEAWATADSVPTKPDFTSAWAFNIVPRAAA